MVTQEDRERAAYEERLMLQLDRSSLMYEVEQVTAAKEQALRAKEQALRDKEQALRDKERGVAIGQIHAYQEILKQPQTAEAELIAMSQEDLAALLAQLRKQLSSQGG